MNIAEIKNDIINKLNSEYFFEFIDKFNINSVMLFGSICTEDFNELSDVDIAILGENKLPLDNILDIELFLEELLKRDIDVVDLKSNSLDMFVKINILNTGKVLHTTDENKLFERFCDDINRIYIENADFMYFRRRDVLS
ncbi:type VII toxin-antitoxin system MntA family adenylyltransferase antitoxin [Clostridium frigidicarnis]|uniref:Predicted nucleotidyltransferase n=1 Tax=Clostridium frigidicarnis TaxID=84698 RepID=A0A1I0XRS9_9CLOT|nr:nucleotidyltransferase domain-containing protein [Clostridium frigidicarnis]SFB03624.1 Predicted nucleotidyltransferase [Clostridium frigidicarnis]